MTKKILYYAINGTGLGHLMRLSSIAYHCQSQDISTHQLIVTNAQNTDVIKQMNIPYISLPCQLEEPYNQPNRRIATLPRNMLTKIIYHIIVEYEPKIIVFDTHFPQKLVNKLYLESKYNLVLVFRLCVESYMDNMLVEKVLDQFNLIIFPHHENYVFDNLSSQAVAVIKDRKNIYFSSPITRSSIIFSNIDSDYVMPKKFILITCGSGGYQNSALKFINLAVNSALLVKKIIPEIEIVIIRGPYLKDQVDFAGCISYSWILNLTDWMSHAQLVIAHAGYNTVNEIIESEAKSLLIPLSRNNDDQYERAKRVSCQYARIEWSGIESSPQEISRLIINLLDKNLLSEPKSNFLGAYNAAEKILKLAPQFERLISLNLREKFSKGRYFLNKSDLTSILLENIQEKNNIILISIEEFCCQDFSFLKEQKNFILEIYINAHNFNDIMACIFKTINYAKKNSIDLNFISIIYYDQFYGALLPRIAYHLADISLSKLIAVVEKDKISSKEIFEHYKKCSDFSLSFEIDITTLDRPCLTM